MKKLSNKLFVIAIAVYALMCAIGLTACGGKTEPVYKGMTIAKSDGVLTSGYFARLLPEGEPEAKNDISENDEGETDNAPNNGEFVSSDDDDEMNNEIEDIVTIEVSGDESTKYYVKPNETFIVQVHVSNPDDYEIQSFTLNGQKYANYMFRQGSTMELLLLEVTAPSTSGYLDLTIDAIKYIDGTEIKDVRMDGNKTIKAGVAYQDEPAVAVKSQTVDTTKATFNFNVSDPQRVIGDNVITAYLSDGDKKLAEKALTIGDNSVEWDNLTMGKTYQYGIGTTYDMVDGKGVSAHWLLSDTFSTPKAFAITNGVATQTGVTFDVTKTSMVGNVTSVKLYDEATDNEVGTLDGTTDCAYNGLLSDHTYLIEVSFEYAINGQSIHDSTKTLFKTLAKATPTVEVVNTTSTQTTLDFDLTTTDIDNILSIDKVELYKGETLVKTLDKTATNFNVSSLTSGTMYEVKIAYSYNLNDGNGVQNQTSTKMYPTLVNSIDVTEVSLVNNNQVRLGEELNLRVYFSNPSNIQLTNIYVNRQKVQVSGGDRKTYAIIKFTTQESGLIDFYVNRVDYNFSGVEVNQAIDSEAHVTFPVFEDLQISHEGVSVSPYEYSGGGIYLHFDNPQNYKVYKINGSADFVKISDNKFFLMFDNYNEHKITSIEYGYDGYGSATQTLDISYNSSRLTIGGYYPIYTASDFAGMSENNYYILMNDIDMRKTNITNTITFGYLNGNGHTVRGLQNVIDTESTNYYEILLGNIYDCIFTELYVSMVNNKTENLSARLLGDVVMQNCTISGDFNTSGYVSISYYYGTSNTFNLNGTTTQGTRIQSNRAVSVENGFVSYGLGGEASVLFGCYDKNITVVNLPDSVAGVGAGAFADCDKLTSVTISNGDASIGPDAFKGCTGITAATVPIEAITIGNMPKANLQTVVINGGTSIGSEAFRNCPDLTSITVPNSVTSIGECAFAWSGLTSITIGNSVTSIGREAFSGCSNLATVNWNATACTSAGSSSSPIFSNCSKLTTINIGNNVTTIPSYAFYDCSSLTKVYYAGTSADWSKISIGSYNTPLTSATRYYYSETEPPLNSEETAYDGNYWHYVDGTPTVWVKQN